VISGLLEKYKQRRKQSWLNEAKKLSGKYAFVGVGSHSLSNLYPVLDFKGVGLKYIHSRTRKNAEDLAQKYPSCKGTDNLNDILSDPEIQGVFICAHPSMHFEITKAVLSAGKHCFVEKPPCVSSEELQELIRLQADRRVVVGFQKIYSQVADKLRAVSSEAISYSYSYHTGAYPEGDPVMDLFIHPCSVVVSLFGAVKDVKVQKSTGTWLVQVSHETGVIGQLNLSIDHDWTSASEEIIVNTKTASYISKDINSLVRKKHAKRVLGIPMEKVLKNPVVEEQLLKVNGFVPMAENNSLSVQGYAEEIDVFLKLSSGRKATNHSGLQTSKLIFELLEKLN
jgi:virulence factor